tara:strand:- start:7618 stop:8115 length:498 start_codon:yes stop_codon:yes gene_type:complete
MSYRDMINEDLSAREVRLEQLRRTVRTFMAEIEKRGFPPEAPWYSVAAALTNVPIPYTGEGGVEIRDEAFRIVTDAWKAERASLRAEHLYRLSNMERVTRDGVSVRILARDSQQRLCMLKLFRDSEESAQFLHAGLTDGIPGLSPAEIAAHTIPLQPWVIEGENL